MNAHKSTSSGNFPDTRFIKGVIGDDPVLHEKEQIAFIGRSNVGKSSTLNTLVGKKTGKKDSAKTSSTPGKTREFNIYDINNTLYFIDLPGFGYAKIPAKEAEKIRKRIIWYFAESGAPIKKVILILDASVGLTDLDRDMLDILAQENIPTIILANKIDKLNQSAKAKNLKAVEVELNERVGDFTLIPFSAAKGIGREEVLNEILS